MSTHDENQRPDGGLDADLARLAERLPTHPIDVDADLARGRRRARARTGARAGVAVAAVAALAGASIWALGGTSPDRMPVADDATATPTPSSASTPSATPTGTATPDEQPPAPMNPIEHYRKQKKILERDWMPTLLAELDPDGGHLETKVNGITSALDEIGVKLGWSNPGESGLGLVQVSAKSKARPGCTAIEADVACTPLPTPAGARGAWTWEENGTVVRVLRGDGSTVTASTDLLYGNNSRVPVGSVGLDTEDLLRVALRPEIAMNQELKDLAEAERQDVLDHLAQEGSGAGGSDVTSAPAD